MKTIADAAGVEVSDILGHDLFLYNRQKGTVWGASGEYISSGRLDDLQCAFSSLQGFLQGRKEKYAAVHCVFDNEEVGSGTRQGAASTFLKDTLLRICENLNMSREDYFAAIADSFLISADNAHAAHPAHPDKADPLKDTLLRICENLNMSREDYFAAIADSFLISADNAHAAHPAHPDKADPVNRPYINEGIVIKFSGNQKYCTDGMSAAIFRDLCMRAQVPVQIFTNRSDIAGGSTATFPQVRSL